MLGSNCSNTDENAFWFIGIKFFVKLKLFENPLLKHFVE